MRYKIIDPVFWKAEEETGKTTVLRGLSYQGQFALLNNDIAAFDQQGFYRDLPQSRTQITLGLLLMKNYLTIIGKSFFLII